MNLFKRKDAAAMTEPAITGTTVLRKTLHAWNRSPNAMARIASEVVGVGVSTLEAFAEGKADLSVEALKALTKVLYPHSEFDPELNLLRSANKQEAKPMCTAYPERFDPKSSPH